MPYDNSQFLTPQEMLKLAKTEEGKRLLFSYIISARIARAVQEIFQQLQVVPEDAVQTKICNIVYDNLFRVNIEDIFQFLDSMQEYMDESCEGFDKAIGHC